MTTAEDTGALWLRRYHPADTDAVRLVCFPHAGGSASFYHPLSARFTPRAEVISLQYPGRQDRRKEPCVTDLGTLADLITEQLLALDERPTVFFGHSMGAALAFETAWRLEQKDAGRDDPLTTVEEAERWQEHTTGAHRLRVFDGGHFFLTQHLAALQAEIGRALD
uniref:thioesterase II family protein n=1 Tax=Streptomyces flavofungini TaxID=68200 RepID=UPI0034DE7E71